MGDGQAGACTRSARTQATPSGYSTHSLMAQLRSCTSMGTYQTPRSSCCGVTSWHTRNVSPILVVRPSPGPPLQWGHDREVMAPLKLFRTWNPETNETVTDLGDYAQFEHGRRYTLRLDPQLPYIEAPPRPDVEGVETDSTAKRIRDWLKELLATEAGTEEWLTDVVEKLTQGCRRDLVNPGEIGKGYYILSQTYPSRQQAATGKPGVDSDALDGSDSANSLIGTEIPLSNHLAGVAKRANQFAESLKLPQELRDDIDLAARLHDIGKVDPRFQSLMVGGDPVELAMREKEPLAKSLPGAQRVQANPGTPRHEIMSVAMLGSDPDILAGAHDRDLVLHLISTHHGWGCPFLPVVPDEDPQPLTYDFDGRILSSTTDQSEGSLALDMADRFWRLIERYGYHGLAWLEAILRLADHRQSELEVEK